MKRIYQLSTIGLLSVILAACGASQAGNDDGLKELEELKSQRKELDQQIAELEKQLRESGALEEMKDSKVLVETLVVSGKPFEHRVEIRGGVASRKNVLISAETMGKIENIHVREGQSVKRGQLLVSMDADVVKNNIKQVTAQLDLARQVFNRQERLWNKNIGTEIQYLEAKANKESLESQLATLNSQLDMSRIKAPFSGVIDNVPAKVGEVAQPGMPLLRLVDPDDAYIVADVSESFLGKFSRGQEVDIYFPLQDRSVVSKVMSVGRTIKAENRTFEMQVELPQLDFTYQPNQIVVLTITDYRNEQALIVPTKIIQSDNEGNYVYVIRGKGGNERAQKAHVEIGSSYDLETEVLQGLEPGQKVATTGHRDLSENVAVNIVQ